VLFLEENIMSISQAYPVNRVSLREVDFDLSPLNTQENIFREYLKSFSRRVEMINRLQKAGKVSSDKAQAELKILWEQLQQTRHDLGLV
jgi:glyceraldehyde-3-phosphate dehydrogenase/erythrose-4-phosphate dehydrogenase